MSENLTAALEEAYASANTNDVILDTLEFRHSTFVEGETPFALRFVRDFSDHDLTLEDDAVLNASESVLFIGTAFDVVLPPEEDAPAPELTIKIDNIGRPLMEHIDTAVESESPVEVTYRPYLSTDPSGPQQIIPITFIVKKISVSLQSITVKCSPKRLGERAFPTKEYSVNDFVSMGAL